MLSLLPLTVSLVWASSRLPTLEPTQINVNRLTTIQLSVPELKNEVQVCAPNETPFFDLKLTAEASANGAFLKVDPVECGYLMTATGFTKDEVHRNAEAKNYFRLLLKPRTDAYRAKFRYYDPSITAGNRVEMNMFCGVVSDNSSHTPPIEKSTLVGKHFLKVAVVEHQVAKLPNPSLNTKTGDATHLPLAATWPKPCPAAHHPTIQVTLDEATFQAGGSLFTNPIANVSVYGTHGEISEPLLGTAPANKTRFSNLEFHSLVDSTSLNAMLGFQILTKNLAVKTLEKTSVNIKFLCENSIVKDYTQALKQAPVLKMKALNGASTASFTLFNFLALLAILFS